MTRTITALFDNLADAQRAQERLVEAGLSRNQISIVAQNTSGATVTEPSRKEGGFWEALADLFLPEEDRYTYAEGIRRGGQLVTVRTEETNIDRVISAIEECGPVDIDRQAEEWRKAGWSAGATGAAGAGGTRAAGAANRTSEGEEVIPVVVERLNIGKREVERGGVRVRSYVVETPVQEQVTLREEHVSVERRPVNQPVSGDPSRLMQERTIDVTESTEKAVVGKEAVVREELVVRKDAEERTETVSDTVRRTEVEVDKKGADQGPGRPQPERKPRR